MAPQLGICSRSRPRPATSRPSRADAGTLSAALASCVVCVCGGLSICTGHAPQCVRNRHRWILASRHDGICRVQCLDKASSFRNSPVTVSVPQHITDHCVKIAGSWSSNVLTTTWWCSARTVIRWTNLRQVCTSTNCACSYTSCQSVGFSSIARIVCAARSRARGDALEGALTLPLCAQSPWETERERERSRQVFTSAPHATHAAQYFFRGSPPLF